MSVSRKIFLLTMVSIFLFLPRLRAQQERNGGYGQNRVQHKNFDWYFYSTDKFDIYYYTGGQDFAQLGLEFLNKEFNRITDAIGYAPFNKTTIFLYNSYTDLQQSNIGVDGDQFDIAGRTNFIKLQLEVAYPGSAQKFREELTYKLSKVLIRDMMFGGSLAERVQSNYLLSIPNWFIDGAARYITYGWSVEMDDYIRDYLSRKNIKKLAKLDENDAGFIGQSVWNYISVKYGSGNLSNILNLTRYARKEESSIGSTLGIRFQTFVYEWQNYYLSANEKMKENYVPPNKKNLIVSKKNPDYQYSQVRVNSTGKKIAYALNYEGSYKVVVRDIESGKTSVVLRGGNRVLTQETNFNIPLIDWLNESTVGFVFDKGGIFYIGSYDLNNKERFEKPLRRFDQIHDFSFNDNGKLAILSANTDEKNDLFLISMRRSAVKRLTNDLFDDIHPRFVPGTDAIVFSSNRTTNFLDEAKEVSSLSDLTDDSNLFIYDLDTTQNELLRITNTVGRDFYPNPQNDRTIFYLTDQKGNANLYRYSLDDSTSSQVTKFDKSIIEFDLNGINDEFTFLMLNKGNKSIFLDKEFDLRKNNFTPYTFRQNVLQAKALVKRIEERARVEEGEEAINDVIKDPLLPDSLLAEEETVAVDTTGSSSEEEFIDADDFVFEEDAQFKNESLSFLSILSNLESEPTVVGPLKYEPKFNIDNITTSFVIDPIRNFGILLEAGLSDLLENHKLYGGVLFMTNFRNGDIFGEYQYLKHRVDFKVRADRKVIQFFNPAQSTLAQKYSLNTLTFGASYPINNATRISINPFFSFSNFTNQEQSFVAGSPPPANFAENNSDSYAGFKAEFVFDNTKVYGLNLYEGTRVKVNFTNYAGISDPNNSFSKFLVDFRYYKRLHREITFATRVFFNGFSGRNRQYNLLGGVDNWVFRGQDPVRREEDDDTPPNYPFILSNEVDNSNILFSEIVTNLRGYDYGRLFGTNTFLFNAEIRFPVFRYLTDGPISSNFLRNFQLVGFYDFGSAWTGDPPFSRENSVNTFRVETDTQFDATIRSFRNPWLASYGFGVRTVLLGYYVRLDWAKPVENFEVGDLRFHLSIGYDF